MRWRAAHLLLALAGLVTFVGVAALAEMRGLGGRGLETEINPTPTWTPTETPGPCCPCSDAGMWVFAFNDPPPTPTPTPAIVYNSETTWKPHPGAALRDGYYIQTCPPSDTHNLCLLPLDASAAEVDPADDYAWAGDITLGGTWTLGDMGAFPTCDASLRGAWHYKVGSIGDCTPSCTADQLCVCLNTGSGVYAWTNLYSAGSCP